MARIPLGRTDFRAPLVIGADGLRSTFAKLASEKIGAFERKDVKCARAYYYAYFEDVPRAKLDDALITEFETSPESRASHADATMTW